MGLHKGWTVTWDRGAWLARAWDPQIGRYGLSKRFRPPLDRGAATDWAKAESANFLVRAKDAAKRGSGWIPTADLVKGYVEFLTRGGRAETHLNDVKLVLGRFAAAIPDLGTKEALEETERWLAELGRAPRDKPTKPGAPSRPVAATAAAKAPISPATRNRYLVTIKALAGWARERKLIPENPLTTMERYTQPKTIKPQFKIEELRRLAGATMEPFYVRFAIMLWAGLRAQEAHNLRWDDIDYEGRMLAVRLGDYGLKGDKERLVPLQRELAAILSTMTHRADGFLFEERLRKAHGSQHGRDLRRFCLAVGITPGDRTPHSLRHCYAGLQTATGVPSNLLKAYMGHETEDTTSGYSAMATRYSAAVTEWRRGEFELLPGATSAWRSAWPRAQVKAMERKAR